MHGTNLKKIKKMVEVFIFVSEVSYKFTKVSGYLVLQVTFRFPAELRRNINESDWRTHLLFPLYQVPGPRSKLLNEGGQPG
jgi:uncharacterized protein involved in tellurium resistance